MPLALVTAVVYLLHQDFWFWQTARPLVFGFLPIGLFYHAVYTLASSLLLWAIVRRHWPSHLEGGHRQDPGHGKESGHGRNSSHRRTHKNTHDSGVFRGSSVVGPSA